MERSSDRLRWNHGAKRALSGAIAAAGIGMYSLGIGQTDSKGSFVKDVTGQKVLWHCREMLIEREGPFLTFVGSGDPIYGAWAKQSMKLEMKRFSGKTGKEKFALREATLEGAVKANLTRPSASGQPGKTQDIELRAAKAVYAQAEEKWTLTGGTAVHRTDVSAGSDTLLTGSSGVVLLYPDGAPSKDGVGVKSASLDQAEMTMHTKRREEVAGSPGRFETRAYTFAASADKLVFEDAKHTITMTGSVHFSGDDPLTAGEIGQVTKAVITLDEAGQPKRIQMDGDPGITKLKQKPKAGGKGRSDGGTSGLTIDDSRLTVLERRAIGWRLSVGSSGRESSIVNRKSSIALPSSFVLRPSTFAGGWA